MRDLPVAPLALQLLRHTHVKLYAGTTEQFRADAQMHRIAEKLRAEYTTTARALR